MNPRFGIQGMSILTLLPLVAMSSALILAMMLSVDIMNRSNLGGHITEEFNELTTAFNIIGRDPALCPLYFQGVNLTPNLADEDITAIPATPGPTNPEFPGMGTQPQIKVDTPPVTMNSYLEVQAMRWVNKANIPGSPTAMSVTLQIDFVKTAEAQSRSYGTKTFRMNIPELYFETGANVIGACLAKASSIAYVLVNPGWQAADFGTSHCAAANVVNTSVTASGNTVNTQTVSCPDGMYPVQMNLNRINNGGYAGTHWLKANSVYCCKVRAN